MSDILMRPVAWLQVTAHELRDREDGQTTTEYAILLGFLAIAIIIALTTPPTCAYGKRRARMR